MKIILTLPSVFAIDKIDNLLYAISSIHKNYKTDNKRVEFRFNTGSFSPYCHYDTLDKIKTKLNGTPLWVDLKCRQLRVMEWANPTYSHITLNHEIEAEDNARILFRGCNKPSKIKNINGNKIFVDPPPENAIGKGQAAIILDDHTVKGYLTEDDKKYIEAAKKLGINNFMASFVETEEDVKEIRALTKGMLGLKIESIDGIEFSKKVELDNKTFLIAARDDLFESVRNHYSSDLVMFDALRSISRHESVVASRILMSLLKGKPTLADLSDILYMKCLGYQNFMLSDELSVNEKVLLEALTIIFQIGNK